MKRRVLNRETVVRAALALVDAEGLDALSMRKLAERLDVEAMSLYNHVRDKADLLDALQDAMMAGLGARARGGDWRALLERMATEIRAALLAHPALIPLIG